MLERMIKSWKIKFGFGAIFMFAMAYFTMMGHATSICKSVESEMFLFLIFGLMGCMMTFLVFASDEEKSFK